jgi:2-polyprenyl-3-methyl-5-hydroxy-6-metoxy-1,4-benzoquinol methylase
MAPARHRAATAGELRVTAAAVPTAPPAVSAEVAAERAERILSDWRGRGRIVVLGAGAHTRKILPVLERHAARIAGIADDSPAAWGRAVGPWFVASPRELITSEVTGVLISSDVQQRVLAQRAAAEFGGRCAILTLHSNAAATGGAPTLEFTGERQVAATLEEIELGHRARYYWALQHLAAGAQVLDAACGNGYGARILADGGARVRGVDICESAVAFAAHHFGGPGVSFFVARIDEPGALAHAAGGRGGFDAVVSLETIEHLERPEVFVSTAATLLRPGGLMLCSTPNADVMPLAEAPFHRRHFSIAETVALLTDCGFRDVAWFGQEGLQILPQRCTARQRYCLFRAVR